MPEPLGASAGLVVISASSASTSHGAGVGALLMGLSILAVPLLGIALTLLQVAVYGGLVKYGVMDRESVPPGPVLLMRAMILVLAFGAVMAIWSSAAR